MKKHIFSNRFTNAIIKYLLLVYLLYPTSNALYAQTIQQLSSCGWDPPSGSTDLVIGISSNGILSGNYNGHYALMNNATVSGTVNINSSTLAINNNVSITIPSGCTLNINASHLYNCINLWQGIVVQPGGTLTITNNSLIEDAYIAVSASGPSSYPLSNIITIDKTIFNKNDVSISLSGFN